MNRFFLRSLSLTVLLSASACGGTSDTADTGYEGKDETCKEQCEELARCDTSVDAANCTDSCTESKLTSKAGQEIVTNCLLETDCGPLAEDLGFADCIDDAIDDVPPSPTGEIFCNDGLGALAQCNSSEVTTSDRAQCLDWVSVFSDEGLSGVNACLEKEGCSAIGLCVASELSELTAGAEGDPTGKALIDQLMALMDSLGSPAE